MPLYDYDCAACGRRFEVVHGVHVEGPTVCPICGSGPIRKAIAAPAIHFKGSGWAKKERRATAAQGTAKASPGDEGGGGSGGETTSGETKSSDNGGESNRKTGSEKSTEPAPAGTAD